MGRNFAGREFGDRVEEWKMGGWEDGKRRGVEAWRRGGGRREEERMMEDGKMGREKRGGVEARKKEAWTRGDTFLQSSNPPILQSSHLPSSHPPILLSTHPRFPGTASGKIFS
jgi:hypothetical protein